MTLIGIAIAVDPSIKTMTLKIKYITLSFKPWKEKILVKVKEKIRNKT